LSAVAANSIDAGQRRQSSVARLQLALLWLTGFSGGFVIVEPAPYEFVVACTALMFIVTGASLRPAHLPLLLLLGACNIGYLIGVVPVLSAEGTAMWVVISLFMSATTLVFAIVLVEDTERRLDMLLKGYVAVALAISIFGIITYFRLLPYSESFLLYTRSKATFKDPNVLGAFLVLPATLTIQRMILGQGRDVVVGGLMTAVLTLELLLAFSRGAWGAWAVSVVILLVLSFGVASARERVRIVIAAGIGAVLLGLLIAVALSLPQVSGLFEERASLVLSYDSGRFGRFGRHILGAALSLDHPFGIGPLQFSKYFPEDPHNSFLDSFMAGGWLSGAAYLALILLTLVTGLRFVGVPTPWRGTYFALYASFVALTGESYIIDVEHWRHYYLIIGALWGLFAAAFGSATNRKSPYFHFPHFPDATI
jgi:hypothetical protein